MGKKTYRVTYIVHAATTVDVEATSLEEAKELADRNVHAGVCNQCSDILDVGDIGDMIQVVDDESGEVIWEPSEPY